MGHGVSLGEHGDGGLCKNLIPDEICHFGSDVDIADAGFGVLQVFRLNGEVCHGIFEPVLHGAEVAADFRVPGLRVVNAVQGCLGAFLRLDVHACQTQPAQGGVGRADDIVVFGGVVAGAEVDQDARGAGGFLLPGFAFPDDEGIEAGRIAEGACIADDERSGAAERSVGDAADIRAVEDDVEGLVFFDADFQRIDAAVADGADGAPTLCPLSVTSSSPVV